MRGWQQAKGIVGHGFNPEKSLRLCVKKYFGPSAKNKKDISRKGAKAQRRALLFKKTINFQPIKHLIFSPSNLLTFWFSSRLCAFA